jgi:hypothetical protein
MASLFILELLLLSLFYTEMASQGLVFGYYEKFTGYHLRIVSPNSFFGSSVNITSRIALEKLGFVTSGAQNATKIAIYEQHPSNTVPRK